MAWQDPRVLSFDPDTGIREDFYYDPDRDRFKIVAVQPVDDILDHNKANLAEMDERTPWKGDMHKVASIPLAVYYDLKRRGILDDQKAMKRWLNDPENRHFRTRPGVV